MDIHFSSDTSITVRFASEALVHRRVAALRIELNSLPILNLHPAYQSLAIDFDPLRVDPKDLLKAVKEIAMRIAKSEARGSAGRTIEIPVHYGEDDGPDLEVVADLLRLTPKEVIELHSAREYEVAFLGFAPGFPYLVGLDPKLHCPRKETPRLKVARGSVGLAGAQTGIYPEESPGGWQIIGRTDLELFCANRENPSLLKQGDRVRFIAQDTRVPKARDVILSARAESELDTLEVVSGGVFSSVQDLGREGFAALGVSPGGAADRVALKLANRLLGNADTAAAVEMTANGGSFRFLRDTWIAMAGGECRPSLDGHALTMGTAYPVRAGQTLVMGSIDPGFRAYLAIAGGIEVPEVLASRSTFHSGHWGGHEGRELKSGDRLATPLGARSLGYRRVSSKLRCWFQASDQILRVVSGPQRDWFSPSTWKSFTGSEFSVTTDANRRGLRLSGPKLDWVAERAGQELVTEGVAAGSIQVPASGQALVLFCEQQTTGGYPKIASVIAADLFYLGQLKPGAKLMFEEVSLDEAWRLMRERDEDLREAIQPF